MDTELVIRNFIIIKGFIDARDERGNAVFGTLLALVSRRELKYLSVMFTNEESSKMITWNSMLATHRGGESDQNRNPMMQHYEEDLLKYLRSGNSLNTVAKNHNTKQAEQSISRYCMDNLQLKAVSFIDYTEASDSDVATFEAEAARAAGPSSGDDGDKAEQPGSSEPEQEDAEETDGEKTKDEIVVRCEPILAPVGGIALNELAVGDLVMARLPEDSVFFKLLSRNIKGFDGVVGARVTGLLQNELGTATVSLSLAEGVSGVMKLSGKVRIKTMSPPKNKIRRHSSEPHINFIVFGVAGAVILIAAAALLYYILR